MSGCAPSSQLCSLGKVKVEDLRGCVLSREDFGETFLRVDEEQLFKRLIGCPGFGVDFHGCHRD